MDPCANLAEQARLLACESASDKARRRELREALSEWLAHGGFAPKWGAYPEAAKAYRAWVRDRAKFQDLYR